MIHQPLLVAACLLISPAPGAADDGPLAVPINRDDMKRMLERSKQHTPRLPLPPLTEEEKAKAPRGELGIVNNGRMRQFYLPAELRDGGFARADEPGMTLGHPLRTMFFWISSRLNNCAYCLGHQEVKLTAAGVDDATLAALDGDWSKFPKDQQAAFAFVRKLSYEPHKIGDADIAALRPYFDDKQILEILFTCGANNAMNRWTGALSIPQEDHRVFLTPTADGDRDRTTALVPLDNEATAAKKVCVLTAPRPKLESREEVEAKLAACRARKPRLPLVDEDKARAALPQDLRELWADAPLPAHVRLLATFPNAGIGRVGGLVAAETGGKLDRKLRAQVAWIAARNDRAWYALDLARNRLKALGETDDAIFALDGPLDAFPADRQAAFAFAKKLTVAPALIEDADVASLRKHYGDFEVAELIHHLTLAAFLDRVTEPANLPTGPGR